MRLGMRVILIILFVMVFIVAIKPSEVSAQLGYPLTIGTVIGDNLRVRGKPRFIGEEITQLASGTKVDIHEVITRMNTSPGEPDKWLKIRIPSTVDVWVSDQYVNKSTMKVMASELNMRGGPGEEFSVLGAIPNDEKIEVVEMRDGWIKIKNPGYATGYVAANFVDYQVGPASGFDSFSSPVVKTVAPPAMANSSAVLPPSSLPQIYESGTAATKLSQPVPMTTSSSESLFSRIPPATSITTTTIARPSNEVIYDYPEVITESAVDPIPQPQSSVTSNVSNSVGTRVYTNTTDKEIGVFYDNPAYAASLPDYQSSSYTSQTTVSTEFASVPVTRVQDSEPVYATEPQFTTTASESVATGYESWGGQTEIYGTDIRETTPVQYNIQNLSTDVPQLPVYANVQSNESLDSMVADIDTQSNSNEPIIGDSSLRPLLNSVDLESAREVTREGTVRGTFSLRSPTSYALYNIDNGRAMDFLWSPEIQIDFKKIAGQRVIVQGREYLDKRWPKTPVLKIEKVFLPR